MELLDCVALVIGICVLIVVISLIMQCISSLWSSLFGIQYTQSTIRQHSYESYAPQPQYFCDRPRRLIIAIDTESVGGPAGQSMLARVSLVTRGGKVFDKYVKPMFPVTDYRTPYSGIRETDLTYAEDFWTVRMQVARLIKNSILVGHDLKHDLKSLNLSHPAEDIRDTSEYKPFKKMVEDIIVEEVMERKFMGIPREHALAQLCRQDIRRAAMKLTNPRPSLKLLANMLLDKVIQEGEHNSIEDAKAAMGLYLLVEIEWEMAILWEDN